MLTLITFIFADIVIRYYFYCHIDYFRHYLLRWCCRCLTLFTPLFFAITGHFHMPSLFRWYASCSLSPLRWCDYDADAYDIAAISCCHIIRRCIADIIFSLIYFDYAILAYAAFVLILRCFHCLLRRAAAAIDTLLRHYADIRITLIFCFHTYRRDTLWYLPFRLITPLMPLRAAIFGMIRRWWHYFRHFISPFRHWLFSPLRYCYHWLAVHSRHCFDCIFQHFAIAILPMHYLISRHLFHWYFAALRFIISYFSPFTPRCLHAIYLFLLIIFITLLAITPLLDWRYDIVYLRHYAAYYAIIATFSIIDTISLRDIHAIRRWLRQLIISLIAIDYAFIR